MSNYKKKDIYIITNNINDKVYIGQSVNPAHRWEQYKSAVKTKHGAQIIVKAMIKYGIEYFTMSILEKDVVNYDEREQYWIKEYNSLVPNGYNVAIGGQSAGEGFDAPTAKIKSEDVYFELVQELIDDIIPAKKLCEKYNISYTQLRALNLGKTYYHEELEYPLRKIKKYTEEQINQLTYSLKYELDKSIKQIAEEYNMDLSYVNEINQGKTWHRDYITYPIRLGKMKKAEIIHPQIQEMLLTSDKSQKEIAQFFNVSQMLVSEINQGKKCYNDKYVYPLRKNGSQYYSTLSPDIVDEICKELKETNHSFKQIGQKYEVSPSVIAGINNGKTKKYRNEEKYKYPIRNK